MAIATEPLPPPREHLRTDPKTKRLQRRTYQVAVVTGPDHGKVFALEHRLIVGSQEPAGLVLADSAVSRHHFELIARPDGVLLRDLESRNGTWVGGLRIQQALLDLAWPTRVRVGRSELEIRAEHTIVGDLEDRSAFGRFRGRSEAARSLCALLQRVAPTNSSVLLLGETGTGKDVLAREIHAHSHRAAGPFVVVDCGGIAPELIESELFGHTKGAFTGAVNDRMGAFEAADGGTLFLDEIGELPVALQPKLLRVLEHLTVQPVGSTDVKRIDVRVIAATHRHLESAVVDGTFRQDLFFRLAVIVAQVPPLRERPEDIPDLVEQMLHEFGAGDLQLPMDFVGQLMSYAWPGNIRELRNVVHRVVLGVESQLEDAPAATAEPQGFKEAKERVIDAFTREYLRNLMRESGGNISRMARASGLNRTHLHRLVARYRLQAEEDEDG